MRESAEDLARVQELIDGSNEAARPWVSATHLPGEDLALLVLN